MAIHVTPIPKLTPFAAPSLTLGTANAAGDAGSTIRSNATVLTYDTSVPAAVAGTAATGSASTAARRDHVHVGGTSAASPKAWCFFDGASLSSPDLGVTSVTKTATGTWTVAWSTNFTGTVYSVIATASQASAFGAMQTGSVAVGTVVIVAFTHTGAASDVAFNLAAFGEQ